MSQKQTVLVVGQNLLFMPRIQNAAIPFGYQVKQTRTETEFWDVYRQAQPALVIVDLEGDEETWPRVVEGVVRQGQGGVRVVAFGPHADVALLDRARKLGCDPVLTKGELGAALPRLMQPRSAGAGA